MTVTYEESYLRSGQARADLSALNTRFVHNFVTNDVAAHAELLHPAFVAIQGDGSVLDREAYLRGWATGFSAEAIPYWDTRAEVIRVIGTVGLVRSTNGFVVRVDGVESERFLTYTDTYVYELGHWLCVQAQLTPVQPAHVPPASTIVSVYQDGVREPAPGSAPR